MNKLGNQYGRKNLASKIKKKYGPKNEETVSENTHTDHFRFLLPLQKAGVPAPSKERAMDLIAKHGDPLRAGKAYVDRYKKIKNAANKVQKEEIELDEDLKQQGLWKLITDHEKQAKKTKNTIKQNHHLAMADRYRGQLKTNVDDSPKVQKEETELDEARTKKSPIEKLFNRPSMQFAKKYTDKDKLARLGFPERHLPKDASLGFTDTGTTSSLEGKAKQGKIEDVAKRTMQNNSYESEGDQFNELVLNPFLRGLLEATCKECGEKYKGKTCPCCMKEDVQIDELFGIGDTIGRLDDKKRDMDRQGANFLRTIVNTVRTKSRTMDQKAAAARQSDQVKRQERDIGVDTNPPSAKSFKLGFTDKNRPPINHVPSPTMSFKASADKERPQNLRDNLPPEGIRSAGTDALRKAKAANGKPFQYEEAVPKSYREDVQLDEILEPSMGAGAYIDDFVNSKDPKFAGKSKEKRRQMALAAYYAAKRGN
jgi:hypothetical protein